MVLRNGGCCDKVLPRFLSVLSVLFSSRLKYTLHGVFHHLLDQELPSSVVREGWFVSWLSIPRCFFALLSQMRRLECSLFRSRFFEVGSGGSCCLFCGRGGVDSSLAGSMGESTREALSSLNVVIRPCARPSKEGRGMISPMQVIRQKTCNSRPLARDGVPFGQIQYSH